VAQELLVAPPIGGLSARPRSGGGGVKEVNNKNISSKPLRMYENGAKTAGAIFALKVAENAVSYLKVLNKIYSRDVCEEYINFKIFRNLRHCGIIPVQAFGSHICPKPPGLGLSYYASGRQ
jgi:hypothetical protein